MDGRTHTLERVAKAMDRLHVKISKSRILLIPPGRLGNKSWGMIDYLIKTKFAVGWVFTGSK